MYELKTEQFSGPLNVLLELIEAKKMEITDINLASVTADFLEYARALQARTANTEFAALISDFLVVAAQLLLLKSRSLLPSIPLAEEDEMDIDALKFRLELCRTFKPAGAHIDALFSGPHRLFARPLFHKQPIVFSPPKTLSSALLASSMQAIVSGQNAEKKETIARSTVVNMKEKMEELLQRLSSGALSLTKLAQTQTRTELIVVFLAMLHLFRDQQIQIEQEGAFADIVIKTYPRT